jgi:hypothetical protein
MLGRFTALFDYANRVPIFGSSRIPVRYHLWVSLAVAALAAVGVDRLARPGVVKLRAALVTVAVLVVASLPILAYVYAPVWTQPGRWTRPEHQARYSWLATELVFSSLRTMALALAAWRVAALAARAVDLPKRRRCASILPVLVIADLLGAHWRDVPTVSPAYWTVPPQSVRVLREDPSFVRLFAIAKYHAGEPGYASVPVDFLQVRDALDWSLPAAWGLATARGETPIIPKRMLEYTDHVKMGRGRFDIESVSHLLSGYPSGRKGRDSRAGAAWITRNPSALARARLVGLPIYASNEKDAIAALDTPGVSLRDRVVVEDPSRPLAENANPAGSARITRDEPELVEVATDGSSAAYLVLADSFDPGWSATLDGTPAPIRPAYVAFRAVYVPAGLHTIVFRYRPAGFTTGLRITGFGIAVAILLLFRPRRSALGRGHGDGRWPRAWLAWTLVALAAIFLASAIRVDRAGHVRVHPRWIGRMHRFTWGAGIEAMRPSRRIGDSGQTAASPDRPGEGIDPRRPR